MADLHVHVSGSDADHVGWSAETGDDDFDADALMRAMLDARRREYAALESLDAA